MLTANFHTHSTTDFFRRIGLPADTPIEHTTAFLGLIQNACVTHIPYENLDILAGKPVELDFDSLYHKIVTCHRGGYCFELNGFLIYMLRNMGFSVRDRFARCLRNEPVIPMRRHRIAVVNLPKGDYMCDIAVGQIAPRLPLKIEAGLIQTQNGETYRFEKDSRHGWMLYEMYHGDWRPFICFSEDDQFDVDYEQPHFYCLHHPDSIFNKKNMLSLKIEGGRKTIDGMDYKVFRGTELAYIEEHVTEERLREILWVEFGIRC